MAVALLIWRQDNQASRHAFNHSAHSTRLNAPPPWVRRARVETLKSATVSEAQIQPIRIPGLEGRVAVVTGAARGVGQACTEILLRSGARVVAVDRQFDRPENGGAAAPLPVGLPRKLCDVIDEEQVRKLFTEVEAELGGADILVNCAGVLERLQRSTEKDMSDWDRVFAVNVRGTFLCCREAGRGMVRRRRGAIVNIGSAAGMLAVGGSSAYGPSKAAVAHLTRSLACEWARFNIRVNCVAPGHTATAMSDELFAATPYDKEAALRSTPIGRIGQPGEIANAVAFLASSVASFITGVVLPVDGGWTCALQSPHP